LEVTQPFSTSQQDTFILILKNTDGTNRSLNQATETHLLSTPVSMGDFRFGTRSAMSTMNTMTQTALDHSQVELLTLLPSTFLDANSGKVSLPPTNPENEKQSATACSVILKLGD
jgi:hypothetical protein